MAERSWVYDLGHGQSGPMSVDQLAILLAQGKINAETLVRPSDIPDWDPLARWLPELGALAQAGPAKGAWMDAEPHPWRRYLARMTDSVVVGTLTWMAVGAVLYAVAPGVADRFFGIFDGPFGGLLDLILTLLVTSLSCSMLVGLTGVSVGKWLFGIRVVTPGGRPIGMVAAFEREMMVLARGLAFGVPLVSLYTLIASYRRLEDKGYSAWDKPTHRVLLHRPMNRLQIGLMIVTAPVVIVIRIALFALSHA